MPKRTQLLLLVLAVFSCHSPRRHWPIFGKWELPNVHHQRPVRGQPKEVIQYGVFVSDSADPEKLKYIYNRYRFDPGGNLIYRGTYFRDTLSSAEEFQFLEGGLQGKMTATDGSSASIRSKALDPHRFETISADRHGNAVAYISTYPVGGHEEIVDEFTDTITSGKPLLTQHNYYDNANRLFRSVVLTDKNVRTEWQSFYSRFEQADSIHTTIDSGSGPHLARREIFVNNDYGDPIRYIVLQGADTIDVTGWKYVYDSHGNWTVEVEFPHLNQTSGLSIPPGSYFALIRKFVY